MIRRFSLVFLLLITCHYAFADQAFDDLLAKAQAGDIVAQTELGAMYATNLGDYSQAIVWWTKAAMQGQAQAQFNLGLVASDGPDVPRGNKNLIRDYKKAYVWFSIAMIRGQPYAEHGRNYVINRLTPTELEEAKIEIAELQKKIEQNKTVNH